MSQPAPPQKTLKDSCSAILYSTRMCARPPAVQHGPCQQGSTRLSPLNAKSPCTFRFWLPLCGLRRPGMPYCLIKLATGCTGAVHAAPGHASSRTTGVTLHLRLCAGLRVVGLKKETAREPSANP
jgi:hypothetical protein